MDRWVLKDGVVCFKSEDAEINGWSLAGLVACLNKRDKTISDLEAKLAESEKAFDTICSKYEKKSKQIFEIIKRKEECSDAYDLLSKENEQLKQQLAEKDAEVQSWKDGTMVVKLGKLEEQLAEKEKEVQKWKNKKVKYIVDNIICDRNQTAIDKLEQLKHDIWTNQHDDGWLDEQVDIYELTEMIDQKIKTLKERKINLGTWKFLVYFGG